MHGNHRYGAANDSGSWIKLKDTRRGQPGWLQQMVPWCRVLIGRSERQPGQSKVKSSARGESNKEQMIRDKRDRGPGASVVDQRASPMKPVSICIPFLDRGYLWLVCGAWRGVTKTDYVLIPKRGAVDGRCPGTGSPNTCRVSDLSVGFGG